jgi:hypothetical protein
MVTRRKVKRVTTPAAVQGYPLQASLEEGPS